jgi:protease-4
MSGTWKNGWMMEKSQWEESISVDKQVPAVEPSEAEQAQAVNTREWQLISRLVDNISIEQRRARRWGVLFKSLAFVYLFGLLGIFLIPLESFDQHYDHVAVIDVLGPIAEGYEASSENLLPSLAQAFEEPHAKAIFLNINSPGGSPVAAGIIYDEINRQQSLYPDKPVYAVIGDIGASGAYYVAAAADYIYTDKASIVGSIGVISSGFGFDQLIEEFGIERRSYVSGKHKAMLDAFQPEKTDERAFFQNLLDEVHKQFIDQVKLGRGDRLSDNGDIFTGLIWTGVQAQQLGLTDGLGNLYSLARDQIGHKELLWYGPEKTPLHNLMDKLGNVVGVSIASTLGLQKNPLQLH